MLMLPQVLSALIITELVARAKGQTNCEPLMQSLLQQAEATNGYGSWDACCARTGTDCFLSRQAVQPGFEPCDVAHSARAGCNRIAQATVCMIGNDGLISGSPCGASIIRTCGSVIALGDGVAIPFNPPSEIEATFKNILARGVLLSQLCCSTSEICTFASPCAFQYNLSACLSDGTNSVCIPLDQPDNTTYAAQIVQDGHNCLVTPTTRSSSPTSTSSTTGSAVPTQNGGGNAAFIGGGVGGAIGFVCIVIFVFYGLYHCRRRRRRNVPSNERPRHQETAATGYVPVSPDLPIPQSTSGHTPSLPSRPGPQWTNAIETFPSFPGPSHQSQNTFEFPANPQNSSEVHQDPYTNIISLPYGPYQSQNILEYPTNPLQVYHWDPDKITTIRPAFEPPASPPPPSFHSADFPSSVSTISRLAFEPPASPPPPSFRTTDFRSSAMDRQAMDRQAMEARITALENRIMALSGPSSGLIVEESRRGGAAKPQADPPRYDNYEQ